MDRRITSTSRTVQKRYRTSVKVPKNSNVNHRITETYTEKDTVTPKGLTKTEKRTRTTSEKEATPRTSVGRKRKALKSRKPSSIKRKKMRVAKENGGYSLEDSNSKSLSEEEYSESKSESYSESYSEED
ncbi:hypothetical protein TNIN_284191 [Trichonephila inaurata madagascariensis]|uniref:Uncharacterized protein n=1 Tax=Trichonephila inaurata madagascariensis TaxID=2747483 RepID=A0A8X7BXE0_9ARAC|nr:hypothetical protein TNIN_284191 [Trichonephila inaurata madagascariensis]